MLIVFPDVALALIFTVPVSPGLPELYVDVMFTPPNKPWRSKSFVEVLLMVPFTKVVSVLRAPKVLLVRV